MGISNYDWKLSLVLVLQTAFFFFGIYIFTQGFLLNRVVVPQNSTCSDEISNSTLLHEHSSDVFHDYGSCWRPARFKKAILIVIDALRYDFMLYNESLEGKDTLSFQNKLGIIHEVLKTRSGHGRIFKFVADPPTTTMQRIKGLTTGRFLLRYLMWGIITRWTLYSEGWWGPGAWNVGGTRVGFLICVPQMYSSTKRSFACNFQIPC